MTRRCTSLFVLALIILSLAGTVSAGEDKVICPVCGYIFDKADASTAVYEGTVYYFCDPGCKAYFLSNPEAMTSGKVHDAVCGMEIDRAKAIRAEHEGREIHFCSEMCKDKYFADPQKYAINYDVVGHQVAKVSEMKHTMEYEGRTFYFMSEENKKKFAESPDSYLYAESPLSGDVAPRENFKVKAEYNGKTYYFHSEECKERFLKNPDEILKARASGKYVGCTSGHQEGSAIEQKTLKCPYAKEQKGCPLADEHKGCPNAKKGAEQTEDSNSKKKDDAKKGISSGCSSKKDGRCYGS